MDKDFWDSYYNKSKGVFHPSDFAKFCLKQYIDKGSKILDIGCGNGRDSNFFGMNKLDVVGFDQSDAGFESQVITQLQSVAMQNLYVMT